MADKMSAADVTESVNLLHGVVSLCNGCDGGNVAMALLATLIMISQERGIAQEDLMEWLKNQIPRSWNSFSRASIERALERAKERRPRN